MKDIQQLIKKNSQEGRYEDVFPKTFIDAVEDRESGNNLTEILSGFNMYFLSYNGSREQTRLQVPMSIRKTGLWITYVLYDKTVVTEWYAGEAIDDDSWKSSDNWRVGTNMLVGDISISSDGYWVVNGVVTTTKAQGEQGITPMLRVGSNNHLQVSYTNGSSWVDASTNPVYTQFRVHDNKLEQSVDLGATWIVVSDELAYKFRESGNKIQMSKDLGNTWEDVSSNPVFTQFRVSNNKLQQSTDLGESWSNISEELAYQFRNSGNKLQVSKDLGVTWEDTSDYIAAWFKFTGTTGSSQTDNVGKIQISRDNGTTWSDLSGEFTNSLYIKGYVATVGALPSSAVQGDIYGVGPTYDPSDTEHTNPIYQLYVKDSTGWVNNGRFTSIAAGVVQELGNSETAVMSQNSITAELLSLFSSLYTLPYSIVPFITDDLSNVFWMSLTPIITKKGSIIKVTFSNMPSIIEPIGIARVKDVTQVLDYLPFYIEGNSVYFVVTQDNISYLRFKLSAALTGTVTIGASDKYTLSTWSNQSNIKINLLQAQTSDVSNIPVATLNNPSVNIYWWTLSEPLKEGVLYSFGGEVDKITKVQVASGYGAEYLLGEVDFIVLNNLLYFKTTYNNANNIRVSTSNGFTNQPILKELYSVSLSEYDIPDLKQSVEYLNSNILNVNMLPVSSRWDANTVFKPEGWFAFRTATPSIIDNYVQVVTAGTIIYEGLRFNSVNDFKGKNIKISFEYKNISNATVLGFFIRTDIYWVLNLTDEWKTFTITIPYEDSYDRLQLSTITRSPTACSFAVRNISVINLNSNTLESRVDKLEEGDITNPLEGKNIAIIGDSISTINGNNTPYITILNSDIGKTIQSWVTWYDIWTDANGTNPTNKTIGGVTLTQAMIGTLQSFNPVISDVGKQIGVALNYNVVSTTVWSEVLCQKTGATLLSNASWSGSRITQRSASVNSYTISHAWSDYTIGRCRVRDLEGNYVNPDVIIIYRGTNDFSHSPYASIEDYDMSNGIPDTDFENGVYNFRKGYELTIQKLREAYPKAYIICCTLNVFKRIVYDKFPTRNGQYTLPQMNNVIRDIANTMGCGLIELDKDGITFENCYPTYISDSAATPTHPNSTGHSVMASKALSDINYVLSI